MGFDSFKSLVKETLYEDKNGPLPGNPDAPTSRLYVVRELEKPGFVYDYRSEPAGQNTCFPTVFVYTTTYRDLPIECAIRLVRDSKPRQVRYQNGAITAWYVLRKLHRIASWQGWIPAVTEWDRTGVKIGI